MSDDELYANIKAAQALAVEKLQRSWGMTAEQFAAASASFNNAPKPSEPNTITSADLEAAWARSANNQFRGLGIAPISDEEAAAIQAKMDEATAKYQATRAAELDDQFHNYRAEVAHDKAAKSGLYYSPDASKQREIDRLVEKTEISLIETRLAAGLPPEPAPRKTPAQIATERHNARKAAQS
jgi:hypothetical protein